MPSSTTHYIAPSAIIITPNANGNANDLAVHITSGAKIKVYCQAIDSLGMVNGAYQEWTLTGKNRQLAYSSAPYTIYARLSSVTKTGYLIFAAKEQYISGPKSGQWYDKYSYVTPTGMAVNYDDGEGWEQTSLLTNAFCVRLGDVSLPENGQRTVTLDTGILGTDQYNNHWQVEVTEENATLRRRISRANAQDSNLYTGVFTGWVLQRVMLVTSEYVTYMEGDTDMLAGDNLLRPILDINDLTPRIIFYAANAQGQPVSGYGGLSAAWNAKAAGNNNYATSVPVTVSLPFVAPRTVGGTTQSFIAAMTAIFGSISLAEQAELTARDYTDNTVELTNFTQESILIRGIADPNNIIASSSSSSSSSSSISPWDSFALPPSTRLRVTCVLDPTGSVFWQVISYEQNLTTYHPDTWYALGLIRSEK